MAKGGLISFTQALAGAYSPKGIRVNAICPGVVLTERVRSRFTDGNQVRFGGIDNIAGQYPFAVGQPEDMVPRSRPTAASRLTRGIDVPQNPR
jgi:NAD(P)-dependent dehydrogenase (short-subunit alcohol dehydrogenase family)